MAQQLLWSFIDRQQDLLQADPSRGEGWIVTKEFHWPFLNLNACLFHY